MTKRSNGEGSVYSRSDGRVVASLVFTDDDGIVHRRQVYRRTKGEARAALNEMRLRLANSEPLIDSKITFETWMQRWLDVTCKASDRKLSTQELYRRQNRLYVEPTLGGIQLDHLKPRDIEKMLLALRESGKSGATRRGAYNLVRSALDTAVRDDLIRTNPAAKVQRPVAGTKEATWLTPEQVKAVIDAMKDHRLHGLVVLLANSGLRIGEALALRWQDMDLTAGIVRVTGTLGYVGGGWLRSEPKSLRSRRSVKLTPAALEALKARRKAQALDQLAVGSSWRNELDLVFTTEDGAPLDRHNALKTYKRFAESVGVGGSFHTLRHSVATTLMATGTPARVIADILGHSSTDVTNDLYSHVSPELAAEALGRLARAMDS